MFSLRVILSAFLLLHLAHTCALAEDRSLAPPDPLDRPALERRIDDGIQVLNRLYWSPTLAIWLDRTGDDLRAHYEGRLNPPWWSSANAVEVLIDFMNATGSHTYDSAVADLYELHRERGGTDARLVAELKHRGQWNADDEAKWQRRQNEPKPAPKAADDSYSQFRNEYLDDSAWWGLAWLKMYDRTKDPKYLATAEAIQAHMARAWRPEKGGGILWCLDEDKQHPNAITNSLFIILSARLYQRTHTPEYLRWAEQTLAWFHAQALFDGSGVVDAPGHHGDYWTYNQGAFLGGLTALYSATGRQEYLDEATTTAHAMLLHSGLILPSGVLVEKLGTKGWDPGLFKGIMIRYLGQLRDVLEAHHADPQLAQGLDHVIRASAASLITHSLAPDGQYTVAWQEGAKDTTANFNTQTSALAALIAVLHGSGAATLSN